MAEGVPLNQLCMICRIELPKYACPRCGTKTCSAPCVKKHKKRAQCSGLRDPAAFLKKSQLATSSGFDRDYNYLTGLERAIDRADRGTRNRGIADDGLGDRRMKRRVEELGIQWRRAPRGMSRQKENATRWRHKQDCMRWSIEWVFPDHSRKVGEALETFSVEAAYTAVQSTYTINQRKQQKRTRKSEQDERRRLSKRRKSQASQDISHGAGEDELRAVLQANAEIGVVGPDIHVPNEQQTVDGQSTEDVRSQSQGDQQTRSGAPNTIAEENGDDESDIEIITELPEGSSPTGAQSQPPHMHFYLLKPFTRSTAKVLRPIDKDKSLAETLQGQEIFEFPTVYALEEGPQSLPEGLIREDQYEAQTKRLIEELDTELKNAGVGEKTMATAFASSFMEPEKEGIDVHGAQVIESLQRDVGI